MKVERLLQNKELEILDGQLSRLDKIFKRRIRFLLIWTVLALIVGTYAFFHVNAMRIVLFLKTANIRLLLPFILTLLLGTTSEAQLKVAQYSYGKYGTDKYEQFEFWTKDGKRADILYGYGKHQKQVKLYYMGRGKINGDSCFKVQFTNNYVLYVIPKELRLRVIDTSGKYYKTFSWEYEGPVNGIGTHCDVCADNDADALQILLSSYLK